jgi:DNA helicase-2/ATP-dependent DNA helicase PcrA
VAHKKFGEGIILHAEGEGDRTRLLINFDSAGEKWLVLGFAPLTPLD